MGPLNAAVVSGAWAEVSQPAMIIGNYIECFNERIYSFSKHVLLFVAGGC